MKSRMKTKATLQSDKNTKIEEVFISEGSLEYEVDEEEEDTLQDIASPVEEINGNNALTKEGIYNPIFYNGSLTDDEHSPDEDSSSSDESYEKSPDDKSSDDDSSDETTDISISYSSAKLPDENSSIKKSSIKNSSNKNSSIKNSSIKNSSIKNSSNENSCNENSDKSSPIKPSDNKSHNTKIPPKRTSRNTKRASNQNIPEGSSAEIVGLYVGRRFECKHCPKRFTTDTALKVHSLSHEDESSKVRFRCDVCGKGFLHRSNYVIHHRTHSGLKPFPCPHCNKKFPAKNSLNAHVKIHVKTKDERAVYACPICAKMFTKNSHVKRHFLIHKKNGEVPSETGLQIPRILKRNVPWPTTADPEEVSKQVLLSPELKIEVVHNEVENLKTESGGAVSVKVEKRKGAIEKEIHTTEFLLTEMKAEADDGAFKEEPLDSDENEDISGDQQKEEKVIDCKLCGKICFSESSMSDHVMSFHRDYEAFNICVYCSKTYKTKKSLLTHMWMHSDDSPYRCKVCNKNFTAQSHVEIHMRLHTGEKPFPCTQCDKRFPANNQLRAHMQVHNAFAFQRRKHDCDECSKIFTKRSHLNRHKLIHMGVKPHKCTYCVRAFSQKSSLQEHLRTHSGLKPFVCTSCCKGFITRRTLNKHKCKTK